MRCTSQTIHCNLVAHPWVWSALRLSMPDAVPSDTASPPAPAPTASKPCAAPQPTAPRAPQTLIPDKAQPEEFCDKNLELAVKKLQTCNMRGGVQYLLCATWEDSAGQRQVLPEASRPLRSLLHDIEADVALPALVVADGVARRLAFARATEFGSLSIGLMRRAVRVMLDLLMQNRRASLPYSGSSEPISPAHVQTQHGWFPKDAVSRWRSPAEWERSELKAVAAAAVHTPRFMQAVLPRVLRQLDLQTREQAALECALRHLHRTAAQPAGAGAEPAQPSDMPDAQEQLAPVPPANLDGAPCSISATVQSWTAIEFVSYHV
jgi:hypothetical protein